ncbi:MAG: hypothetical protein KDB14_10210 [Planctomycetales bacterium]|nr:hypothetical protein [Planctomycetales bacterium]
MMNPYASPAAEPAQLEATQPPIESPTQLFLECVGLGFCVSALFAVIADRSTAVGELGSLVFMMPIGMIVHQLLPTGWLFWVGCGMTVRKHDRRWLWLVAASSAVFGATWPQLFAAMID